MYDLFKTGAAVFCFFIGFIIILLIVKAEEKNEKNK